MASLCQLRSASKHTGHALRHNTCPVPPSPQCLPARSSSRRTQTCAAVQLPELASTLLQQAGTAHPGWAAGAAVNSAVFVAGSPVLLKGLTGWGMVNAFILGTTVFAAFGAGGFALVCIYFLFGTAVRSDLGPDIICSTDDTRHH